MTDSPALVVERVYREHRARILAALLRVLGDFELAEDALQDACASALRRWVDGVPDDPLAWLLTVARNQAIDRLRRARLGSDKEQASGGNAQAPSTERTDWAGIVSLDGELLAVAPTPVVALNHAVAVAMATEPGRGLALIDRIDGLDNYHLMHAARADLLHRLGRVREAAEAYRRADALATSPADRRFLAGRLLATGSMEA